jgi:hypothetical protein
MRADRLPFGVAIAALLSVPMVASSGWPSLVARSRESSIVGRVVSGGESLPGVVVTLMPEAGGPMREATAGRDGTYQFADLPDGVYRLDFDLVGGFDVIRRNHVAVRGNGSIRVDVSVPLSTICECIEAWAGPGPDPRGPDLRERVGQVVDESGQPLAHARLELVSPTSREIAYADREGRLRVLVSASQTWLLTASDSGFRSLTLRVSGDPNSPLTFRLPTGDTATLPDTERFNRWCRCGRDLFRHPGR